MSHSRTQEEQVKETQNTLVTELAASAATKLMKKGPEGSGAEGKHLFNV